ncbi:hypothetical protein ISN45_At05g024270 [Arabidopsis thaliana x Arabidopsis arenosa]|uniref:DUF4283 domain-containing protein n=3 Tax=Arabidopsis TaxID=3701 RepID=A0A178ULN3_ARATH|nr:putative nucleic-acid protein [Arabidopsis thaliana]AED93471.1 putative nucleic-acid protein [Arabidopsis thaliana]KAG7603466.1 hypothetical protein ISN45_At05g024270 [Arabidopsis thaliana x Arabidopsis arenosa]OAO94237.1 hypothetical protein AXX17_AT5G25590 [Arabidopsis thaliana]|eukprot:NP_197942.1 putative nucleic-acid protein [Arabidopsis thaliana]
MADEIWHDIQYMVLGRDDPELFVPQAAYGVVVAGNRLSLIARPLNIHAQHLRRVLRALPRSWGMASRVHGRIIDDRCIQFRFRSGIDLASVMLRGPWLFNQWFVPLQRWEDFPRADFLTYIDLWVQVRGIPLYVSTMTVRFIASTLGPVTGLDFDEETSTQIAFIRVKVRISITDRMRFFRRVRFESREGDHHNDGAHVVDDEADVLMVPVWEEGGGSNNPTPPPPANHSSSSDISSHRPISQAPTSASPGLDLNEPAIEHLPSSVPLVSPKALSDDSTTPTAINDQSRYACGESSKRRKGKQIDLTPDKKKKQYRKDYGVRFYSESDNTP